MREILASQLPFVNTRNVLSRCVIDKTSVTH